MPGRTFSQGSYRYGFNGKQKDNEVRGTTGLSVTDSLLYDYGARIYDPRIGKFLSVDPLYIKYPELTPYQFASNKPINSIDLDGEESKEVYKFTNSAGVSYTLDINANNQYGLVEGTLFHIITTKEIGWKQINKQSGNIYLWTSFDHIFQAPPRSFLQGLKIGY